MIVKNKYQLLNRTFARRIGKSISVAGKKLLAERLPEVLFNEENFKKAKGYKKIILEIGFGMGEHLVLQAQNNPLQLFIGAEVYLNGVANTLSIADERAIQNILIWPDDIDLIFDKLPERSLDGVYILFPDPWPKNKQKKKRLFNQARLDMMQKKLKQGAWLVFGSDIVDYFDGVLDLIDKNVRFDGSLKELSLPYKGYLPTKYHEKAIREGRESRFLKAFLK